MNGSLEKVLAYLTGYENIEGVAVNELQNQVAENPYFPVSQFLLAKKLKMENDPGSSSQVQKTALYFTNHYWLHYVLSEEDIAFEPSGTPLKHSSTEDTFTRAGALPGGGDSDFTTVRSPVEVSEPEYHEVLTNAVLPENNSNRANASIEEYAAVSDTSRNETVETADIEGARAEEEMAAIARNTTEAAETFIGELEPMTTVTREAPLSENLTPAGQLEVNELAEEMAGGSRSIDETTEHFLEDLETEPQHGSRHYSDDEHDKMFQNIKAMLDATTEDADADVKNAVVTIDPYYTIDYFASQGINLELEKNPQDQLGQNLKKFTEWLKHMKKLGPEDATEVINRTETEADIQQIADSSNTVREVVTEAMALVPGKQGKKDKAIELYNKLSFLNPDKSAYFADKIKKLKGI